MQRRRRYFRLLARRVVDDNPFQEQKRAVGIENAASDLMHPLNTSVGPDQPVVDAPIRFRLQPRVDNVKNPLSIIRIGQAGVRGRPAAKERQRQMAGQSLDRAFHENHRIVAIILAAVKEAVRAMHDAANNPGVHVSRDDVHDSLAQQSFGRRDTIQSFKICLTAKADTDRQSRSGWRDTCKQPECVRAIIGSGRQNWIVSGANDGGNLRTQDCATFCSNQWRTLAKRAFGPQKDNLRCQR